MPTLSPNQRAALESQIAAGQEASGLLDRVSKTCPTCGHGTNILKERINQIIKESRDWFRQPGSSKDDHVAVRFVAALAEVYDLEAALGYRERAAASAREKLFVDQTAEA